MRATLLVSLAALAGLLPLASQASATACDDAIAAAEARHPEIPSGLLAAIGRVESGRSVKGGGMSPWPYTLNVDGSGHFFNNLGEAMGFLREDRNWQARSVDIGCMQVNLRHHPEAFGVHAHGFDAERNVDYAARFLLSLRQRLGSWSAAIMHYHSGDPVRQTAYLNKVRQQWRDTAPVVAVEGGSQVRRQPSATAVAGTLSGANPGAMQAPEQTMQDARQRFASGDYAGAGRLCESLRTAPAWQLEAHLCLGMVAESGGNPAVALGHYLEVLVAEPGHGPALRSLTRMAQFSPQVFDAWDKDLKWRDPAHALPVLLTLSRARLPRAADYLAQARTLAVTKGDAQALWVIATQYESAGQWSVARQLYEQLLDQMPQRQLQLSASMGPLIRERLQRLPATTVASAAPAAPPGAADASR